jgi:hypothetical protein
MTTRVHIEADLPESLRETHHVRVGHWATRGEREVEEYFHHLKHGEIHEVTIWSGGRYIMITEEPK